MPRRHSAMLQRLMARLGRLLFALARTRWGGRLARRCFPALCRWLPVRRLCETETLLAFQHPRPSYPVHILLVPKAAPSGIEALRGNETALYADLVAAVQRLVRELDLARHGYRLIINGGAYQDVPMLHAHLISQEPDAAAGFADGRRVNYNGSASQRRA